MYVFSNLLQHENMNEAFILWNAGVLNCFIVMLDILTYPVPLEVNLKGFYHMLKLGEKIMTEGKSEKNMVLVELEKAGVTRKIDELQDSYRVSQIKLPLIFYVIIPIQTQT